MARTPKPIRRLTAVELEIEKAEAVSADDEREATLPDARTLARRIPEQADAPIITSIADHKLIRAPGRPIEQTAPIAGMSGYLAERFKLVITDIEGNAGNRVIEDFRQGETLLHDWSISNLLAFGTHLYLLESHADELRQELLEDATRRLDALIRGSREFINSFEEWHEYIEQSTLLDIRAGGAGDEIISIAKDAAEGLSREKESVDREIPSALAEYANTAAGKGSKQGIIVNVMSALRSITNISITFVEYVTKVAKDGYSAMAESDRVKNLLRTICDFFPLAMKLAAHHPSLSWILDCSDVVRAACERLRKATKTG